MLVETPEKPVPTSSAPRPRHRGRTVLLGGVAAACVLGVGLGLWARPAMQERRAAATPPPDAVQALPPPARKLQIVVDARPLPTAAPIAVLPAAAAATPAPVVSRPTPSPPEPLAPARPAEGLIKAVGPALAGALAAGHRVIAHVEQDAAAAHAPPQPTRVAKAEAPRKPAAPSKQAEALKLEAAKAQAARAQDKARAERAARVELAKAQAAQAKTAKLQLATAEAARSQAHKLKLAQIARQKAAAAKAERTEKIRLAEAEARGRAEARAEARQVARQEALADARKRARLEALAQALARAAPHRPARPPIELAKVERRHKAARELKVEQASLKAVRRGHEAPKLAAARPVRARPEPLAPQPTTGLVRVSTSRCANRDPGEAAVCADPSLGAAERQLTRAYQGARAAGVPDAQLRVQQQHWLAARSAAAREAPWAVRDVYMARIAELNGQAKDAQQGY